MDCLTLHCLMFEVLAKMWWLLFMGRFPVHGKTESPESGEKKSHQSSTQRISSTAVEVQVSVVQVPSHRHVGPCMPSNHRPLLAQKIIGLCQIPRRCVTLNWSQSQARSKDNRPPCSWNAGQTLVGSASYL